VDPSGGSQDSFTAATAHMGKDGMVILDAIRERRPPFSPDGVTQEFARFFASYNVATIMGDKYAGEWPRERFKKHGIRYEANAQPKSDLYRDLLPLLNSEQVELLDVPRLAAQLAGLERRTSRSGKDTIDHAPRGHDDLFNAAAGVIVEALALESRGGVETFDFITGEIVDGWDSHGCEWRNRMPYNGLFPGERNAKGQLTSHPARFINGVVQASSE